MKKKFTFCLAVFSAVMLCVACSGVGKQVPQKQTPQKDNESGVSFESFSPRSLTVTNKTGERLVAFKGKIEAQSLISGVPANATNHGLRMDANLFAKTEDFPVFFITEKVFNEHKDNLSAVQDSPFACLYGFYSTKGSDNSILVINSKSEGNLKIKFTNDSPVYVKIKLDNELENFACVPPFAEMMSVNIKPGDYQFYISFTKYSLHLNEKFEVLSRFKSSGKPFFYDIGIHDSSTVLNVGALWKPEDLDADFFSTGGCWLTVHNLSKTSISLKMGNKIFLTSQGFNTIVSGAVEMFFLPFPKEADGSYPKNFKIDNLTLGALAPFAVPEYSYKLDTQYRIVVNGECQDNLSLEPLQENAKLTTNEIVRILFGDI